MALKPLSDLPASDPDSAESLTSDSEYSGDDQGDTGNAAAGRPRISKQSLLAHHISDQIALLYHYSALLRRPRLGGRYLRSGAGDERPDGPGGGGARGRRGGGGGARAAGGARGRI